MPSFKYRARDKTGRPVRGMISSSTKEAVAKLLEDIGYIPISVSEVREVDFLQLHRLFGKVTTSDINMFTRQLLALQRAGLPLLVSLGAIEKQTKSRKLGDVIKEISSNIEAGSSFSSAMEKHTEVFSELYVSIIHAGEISGTLDGMLERLAELGEKDFDTLNKIKSATRYPMIAFAAICIAFTIIVTLVIPKFATVYDHFRTQLPLPTRVLIAISIAMRKFWPAVIILGILAYIALRRYLRTQQGKLFWDSLKLGTPVIGPLTQMLVMSRFARVTSVLLGSGIPILQVLDVVSRTVDNAVLARAIDRIYGSVKEGKGLAEPMRISGVFPPIVIQMVSIGEETGKIEELLLRVSEYYERESDYIIKNLTVMIEPMFILFLGVMVLIMALAVFLPMWNLASLFR